MTIDLTFYFLGRVEETKYEYMKFLIHVKIEKTVKMNERLDSVYKISPKKEKDYFMS